MDDALVAPEHRLKIGTSNLRLSSNLKSKEPTLQVVLDALKLTPFYNAFEISADVPKIYMQEFWVTVTRHHSSLHFKLDGKNLGHTSEIKFLSDVNVNHKHQPWRLFAAIINKCLSGKTNALESLRLSRAQILWGMYHNKQVDYVYLLLEDLDQAIARRNKMFWHYARDDFMFTTIRVISEQMKLATKRSLKEFHISHASGSGDGVDILSKVPDEQQQTRSGTNEGAGDKLEVPDVPEYRLESEEESWTFSQGEDEEEDEEHDSDDDNDDNDDEDDDQENDSQRTESDDEGDDFVHPNLSTYIADDQEKEKEEEKADDDDDDDDDTMGGEQEDEEDEELYGDLNINLSRSDAEMTDAQTNPETEEAQVTLTTEPPVVQLQSSSASSDLLREEAQAENQDFLNSLDSNMKRIIKEQRFYGYATNMETSKDVYSKQRIIDVTSLKIMELFGYKHLEEIIVRRQDDKLYKFQEGDFKRLCRKDIEDMLLLLVQGKRTNLNVDERFALNVALRMYTRRIVIQEHVEDLQLAKRLMHTDELHKFSDGTLNHVRTSLNDIATGIQMEYLPKRKWSKQDKQRARVMIKAIDKKLKDKRLMQSLEKFVGGRPYKGDLRTLGKNSTSMQKYFIDETGKGSDIEFMDDPIDAKNSHDVVFDCWSTSVIPLQYSKKLSNPRQQATINNGRVTLQPIQGRQTSIAAGTSRTYTPGASGNNFGKQRTAMPSSEQSNVVNHSETEITSDSNIIPYSQYLIESQQVVVQNSNSSAQQDDLILSVIEQLNTQVVHCTKTNLENKVSMILTAYA
ncbi:hypothetical protein Tco_0748161 [Tanacetum coccineum]|uniref:Uncharacterized protein n=1 Tax=Tanacetum coccineum TaxID=301880 RepID=A0ABQ4YVR5_9ASTR